MPIKYFNIENKMFRLPPGYIDLLIRIVVFGRVLNVNKLF
jgi:hypothetical protein